MISDDVPDVLRHITLDKLALPVWVALHLNQRLGKVARGPAIGPPPI
jgi:hypothetical protein